MQRTVPMVHSQPRLVDDLIPLILESHEHWWARDLRRLALISSAWIGPVRRRLYACPTLWTYTACVSLVRTLTESPRLLSLLWGIELRPMSEAHHKYGVFEKELASIRMLLSLNGLRCLTLGGELAIGAERFLHALASPHTITNLCIDGSIASSSGQYPCSGRKSASLEWDEAMACKFLRLRSLRLSNMELSIFYSPMPYPRLTNLSLDNVDIVDGILSELCHGSWGTLRSMSVTTNCATNTDEHLRSMVACCRNLESLHYAVFEIITRDAIFVDDFPSCPSLLDLRLSGFMVNPHTLISIAESCRNLEQLSILGRLASVTPDDWTAFVVSNVLPNLQRLTTPSGTFHPPFICWSKCTEENVRKHCASRNIMLL